MNRRFVIAIALSAAILFFWQLFLAPSPRTNFSSGGKNNSSLRSTKKALPVSIGKMGNITATRKVLIAKPMKIFSNSLMKIGLLDNGTIGSLKLLKYKDDRGMPTELITQTDNFNPLQLVFVDSKLNAEAKNVKYAVTINGNKDFTRNKTTVTYTGSFKNFILKKVFTFYPKKYLYDLNIIFENKAGGQLAKAPLWGISLGPHLGHLKKRKYGFQGAAVYYNGKLKEYKKFKKTANVSSSDINWIGLETKYFATLLIPGKNALGFQISGDKPTASFYTTLEYSSPNVKTSVYMGPKEYFRLKPLGHNLIYVINYGMFGFLARPLLVILHFFYNIFGNYGLAIIFVTVIIRVIFAPLSHKSFLSMKRMQKLQPQIKEIKNRYKGKSEQLNKATMELYKKYKVNPMGGCLPVVVQIPVFFALYKVLLSSIELLHAPFFFWIKDLSAADPYYITPILMGISMFLQQKLSPAAVDPRQAKIMMFLPVIFTFLFIGFPSGLVLYWLTNNIIAIAQQVLIDNRTKL